MKRQAVILEGKLVIDNITPVEYKLTENDKGYSELDILSELSNFEGDNVRITIEVLERG